MCMCGWAPTGWCSRIRALERPRPGETAMERRRQRGRCMRCGDPADGKSLCPAHLAASRQYQAQRAQRPAR